MRRLLPLFAASAVLLPGCVDCGRCVNDLFELTVTTPGGASEVRVSGIAPITCNEASAETWTCVTYTAAYGDYRLVVSAPGFDDATVDVTLEDQGLVGCACPETVERSVTLAGGAPSDAGVPRDGG